MSAAFRSLDVWKSALLTLPDGSFFELMRSVFGNVKTPFNKQRLVADLEAFLSRKETQETIAMYIDETDARVIAAIASLEDPVPGDLEAFFAGEFSYPELRGMVINLEERLIVYRFQEKAPNGAEIRRLALNPLLESVLSPVINNVAALFPSEPLDSGREPGAMDDRILAALLAFAVNEGELFKAEGGMRKKALDDGKDLFPDLDVESVIGGLQCLGLLRQSGEGVADGLAGGLAPDESKLRQFQGLSYAERREYLAAGICAEKFVAAAVPARFPGTYGRFRFQGLARFIHAFLGALRPDRQYPKPTLRRIADLLERSGIEPAGPFGLDVGGNRGNAPALFDSILDALKTVDLLGAETEGLYFRRSPPDPAALPEAAPAMAMDTAFSCILYPEIRFADALALASFSLVRETGATVRFELTRDSVVRGFDRGMDAEAMLSLLDRLSGNQVEESLRWTLKDWETRYAGVSLYQGLVLTLAEDRRYLAEAHPVASLIDRTLSPGVYLLSAGEKSGAINALHKAGIDIVAQPPQAKTGFGDLRSAYPSLDSSLRFRRDGVQAQIAEQLFPGASEPGAAAKPLPPGPDTARAEQYKERFRAALGKLTLTKGERDELSARIERRLILNESQLVGVSVRYEKLEARGLDYVGKTAIAKQAIASKQLIEIAWTKADGEATRAIGIPEGLEKSGGDTILVLNPVPGDTSQGEQIRLPLGKISLLRRIKQSIFGE